MSKKYYTLLSSTFLFLVPWVIEPDLKRLFWLSVIFLILTYVPMSYQEAIEERNFLKGFLNLLRVFFLRSAASFVLFLLLVTVFMALPPSQGESLNLVEPNIAFFLLWSFASMHAFFSLVWFELGQKNKVVEEKEDLEPDVEE